MNRILFSAATALEHEGLPADQVVDGRPTTAVWQAPIESLECGIWEHTVGTSTDVEVHEVFVVLTGRARIAVVGQPDLHVGPGDIVELQAGAETTWFVEEPLRKFWLALP